jgi:hypothetical protein
MKVRYRFSYHFECWVRMTEICDPGTYPYWINVRVRK